MKKLVQLFAALLIAGCGEKSLSDSKVKKLLEEAVEIDSLQERDALVYRVNESEPYSGWAKEMYDSGQVKGLAQFKDGKPDGLQAMWYENGQKSEEYTYKDGKYDGLGTNWYENGQKAGEGNFKDGKPNGLAMRWYENGQKHSETNFKDGESLALIWNAFVWKPNGDKCPLTNLVNGNGVVVEYKEDGTEKRRVTYNDGVKVED